jgi:hypothetical protein
MGVNGEIRSIYLGLVVRPYRFVVQRQTSSTTDLYIRHAPKSLKQLMLELFTVLSETNVSFIQSLAEADDHEFLKSRQERRFIAGEKNLLYIATPRLADKYAVQFQNHWIATNVGHKEVYSIARLACQVAHVPYVSISKLQL